MIKKRPKTVQTHGTEAAKAALNRQKLNKNKTAQHGQKISKTTEQTKGAFDCPE